MYVHNVFHGPSQCHSSTTCISHYSFGASRGSRSVNNVQRMSTLNRNRIDWVTELHGSVVVQVSTVFFGSALRLNFVSLHNKHFASVVLCNFKSFVNDLFVIQYFVGFKSMRGCNNETSLGVFDTTGEFLCGKTSKNNRMYRTYARRGLHCENGFRDLRHVNDYFVPFLDPQSTVDSCQSRYLLVHLSESVSPVSVRHCRVPMESWLVT